MTGSWRKLHEKLCNLYSSPNKMMCMGHRQARKKSCIFVGEPEEGKNHLKSLELDRGDI
jgi:hypothetical protein